MRELLEGAASKLMVATGAHSLLYGYARRRVLKASRARHGASTEGADSFQVIMYHRVDPHADPFLLTPVTPRQFEAQLRCLATYFTVLPLFEIVRRAEESSLPSNAVAITFDDGYRDNFTYAFPILRRLGLPATLFLAAGCIEDRKGLWYDEVFDSFRRTSKPHLDLSDWGLPVFPLGSIPGKQKALEPVMNHLRSISDALRRERLAQLFDRLGVKDFAALEKLMLTWDEALELDCGGFTLQAHTLTHPILSRVTAEQLEAEIGGSKRMLEARLQRPVELFAYPNGKKEDFDEAAKDAVRRHGFRAAFSTVFGRCRAGDDRFAYTRASPWHHDLPGFSLDQFKIQLDT